MTRLKKLNVAATAIAVATLISACGGGGSSTPATPTPAAQTITFTAPSAAVSVGGTVTLSATASSALAVSFATNSATICTVSGSTVTAVAAGTCSITASQAGNSSFAAATPVTQTFNIAAPVAVFSSGFTAGATTLNGGGWGGYSGSDQDGWNCNGSPAWCGGGSGAGTSAATSYAYYYYQTPKADSFTGGNGEYVGMYVQAPGVTALKNNGNTAGLQLNGQTSIAFTFNDNPEWANQSNHNVVVILTLGNFYTAGTGACNVKLQTVFTPTGGATATAYTLPLSQFLVSQNCGNSSLTPSSVTAALANNPVSQIDFQGDGGASAITVGTTVSSANNTNAVTGLYPTTVSLTGPITFK